MKKDINIVDEIKSRVDIVEYIGRTVKLRKSGSNWIGLCPFRAEKTPSFYIYADSQSYYCFSCHEHGDVITFCEKQNSLSFIEACQKMAQEYNIEWEPGGGYGTESKLSKYHAINASAGKFYYDAIFEKDNPAYRYLVEKRGITVETIKKFRLGYADSGREKLTRHLESVGHSLEDAEAIGLIKKDKNGYRDKFYNRVIFPIISDRNKVIGFGGRLLSDDNTKAPKYLNSDASPVFQKKDNLYALNLTGKEIRNKDYIILVEGYMDVIALYQQDVKNVTAALGTAFTPDQAEKLKRYSDTVVISFDSDAAGIKATLRGIEILKNKVATIRVLSLDDAKDPDEFIKKFGRARFEEAIKKSITGTAFRLKNVRDNHDLTAPEGSVDYLKDAKKILRDLSPVEADYYIKILAKDTGISDTAIKREVFGENYDDNSFYQRTENVQPRYQDDKENAIIDQASLATQRNIIRLLIENNSFVSKLEGNERVFSKPELFLTFEILKSHYNENPDAEMKIDDLLDKLEPENRNEIRAIVENILISDNPDKQIDDCLRLAEIQALEKRENQIMSSLQSDDDIYRNDSEEVDDSDLMKKMMEELQYVKEKIQELRAQIDS